MLSTLHTNDAPSSINRLVNMGVEPFLVANSVNLVCAQRLVRRICDGCKEPAGLSPQQLVEAGFDAEEAATFRPSHGRGCDRCGGSGYKGRVGLFEVMEVDRSAPGADRRRTRRSAELRAAALRDGMLALRQSGLQKVREGVTTLEEVVRETM